MNENLAPELTDGQLDAPIEQHELEMPETQLETTLELPLSVTETKEGTIDALKKIANQEEAPSRAEVDALKHLFYRLHATEVQAQKEKFVTDGGDINDFTPVQDLLEETLKELLHTIKEKRAKVLEAEEKLKAENLERKLKIIEAIKSLTESSDDFNKLYKEFKDLQTKWNEIKLVPASEVNNLWKSYQIHTEKFYDLLKINNEFRDYDFKKNLEMKTQICESVEKLVNEQDVVSAFYQLQNFHQQWREIGPVAREYRDEIWNRFKEASAQINKRYQKHFEDMKGQEEANLAEKTAITEKLKEIDYSGFNSFKEWDEKSKEIIELQAKWKAIGFVPRKINAQIFEEFRSLCDTFFEKKAGFFRSQKEGMEANLEKKQKLVEKAEALKESIDWSKTTEELIALQKEWKTIGAVPRRFSDAIWKEFVTACDYFFEQKKKANSSQREEEEVNLAKKHEIIEKINAIEVSTDPQVASDALYAAIDEWRSVGFVPFKEKDKLHKLYQAALDDKFDKLKIDRSERKMQSFRSNLGNIAQSDRPKSGLYREREKLMHQYNKVKSELQTYENNMGFLSLSKSSGGLLKDMNAKIGHLKNDLEMIGQKVKEVEENISELDN